MGNKNNNRTFWNLAAKLYHGENSPFNRKPDAQRYGLISAPLTKEMRVWVITTGNGLVAVNTATQIQYV